MAYVKKRSADHLLVAYRPLPGMPEERWRCPDEESFERFATFEAGHKRSRPGVPVPDPGPLFGEVQPSARGRKPKPERHTDKAAAKPAPARCFTLREWLGSPDKLGPYFAHSAAMGEGQRSTYFTVLDRWAAAVASKPMDQVGVRDVNRIRDTMLVCKACLARAEAEGRADLTTKPWDHLLATMPPWDGRRACIDDDGGSTHYPRLQSHTIRNYLVILKAAWNAAIDTGSGRHPAERRCVGIVDNPFKRCRLPKFDDRPDNNDVMQALTHAQVAQYEAAMPPELACSIPLSVHAMLRREEVLGLNRGSIDWSTFDADRSVVVRVGQVLRPLEGLGRYGKTDLATREPIYLSSYASERLREHLDRHRSTAAPDRCEACAAGHGLHYDLAPNPHRRCPMADDAPVFAMPSTGERPHPDSYSAICVEAGVRAGLTKETIGFRVTHKVLRATGATMLLEAKVEPETVQRMGRWTNVNTLRRHYVRIRDTSRASAAAALDAQARGELGLATAGELGPSDENPYLRATIKHLTDKLERYKAALVEHGVDVDALDTPTVEPVRLRPPPGQQAPRQKRPPSPFEDDDLLRRCVREGQSRNQVLIALGVAPATKNYRRLEQRAAELGLELPPKLRRAS